MLKNGETYYLSTEEIASSIQKYDSGLYHSYLKNENTLLELDSFADDSVNVLIGDTWDAIRGNLNNYMDCAKASSDLNKLINEVNKECLQMIQKFLGSDSELNTADLPKFEEERDRLEAEIEAAYERIDQLKTVPATIPKTVTEIDSNGKSHTHTIQVPNEPAYSDAQNEIANLNHQINSVLTPALNETNRLIDKINTFNDVILPQINEKLDSLQDKIIRFENAIDMLGTSNPDLLKRYLTLSLRDDSNAEFYYDETGKPYAVYYPNSFIYIDYTDPDSPKYSRYNPLTKEYSDISIFDGINARTNQYGADQCDFSENFDELINDPKIWEEMQKYYPVESFDSVDEAMEFYEKYFSTLTNTGCGYAVATDFVFDNFKGREAEFEKTFGYPMYSVDEYGNIDFNYEQFMLGHFNYNMVNNKGIDTVDKFDSAYEYMKLTDEYNNILQQYSDANFFERIVLDFNGTLLKGTDLEFKIINCPIKIHTAAENGDGKIGHLDKYLQSFGIDTNYQFSENNYDISEGAIIATQGYTLSDRDNIFFENGGKHYMYVTGFNDDGEIFISSWGKAFNINPKLNDGYFTQANYSIKSN